MDKIVTVLSKSIGHGMGMLEMFMAWFSFVWATIIHVVPSSTNSTQWPTGARLR